MATPPFGGNLPRLRASFIQLPGRLVTAAGRIHPMLSLRPMIAADFLASAISPFCSAFPYQKKV